MKGTYLGEFEEIVLLTVGVLYDDAYGVAIVEEIERQTERAVHISAVHSALHRLEEKGFVSSRMGGATQERGGRKKRLFAVSLAGQKALKEAKELRNQLWQRIPDIAFQGGKS